MPLDMNVFRQDAFSMMSMSTAIDRLAYVPSFLQSIPGIIVPEPVRSEEIWIEDRDFGPKIIPMSPRGAPPSQVGGDKRKARAFKTVRYCEGSRITPSELQNIRAFGSNDEVKSLQIELARRMMKIKSDFQLTKEFLTLGMIQGMLLDYDGRVEYDWAVEFSQPRMPEFAFDLPALGSAAPDTGSIRATSNDIARKMLRALRGLGGNTVRIYAACGDEFWDRLVTSEEVKRTYLNWQAAEALRNGAGSAFGAMLYGDIYWFNYRGTDDATAISIQPDKAKFFPVNAGIFRWARSPGERFETINTPGEDMYSWMAVDPIRDMWADVECASYPLPVCVQPGALASGRAGA